MYGLSKLLQDRTSGTKGAKDKLVEMQRYFNDFFTKGLFKQPAQRKEGSGAGGSRRKITATLAEAIARLQGCTAIQAENSLKALGKESFDAILANERVIAVNFDQILATRAFVEIIDILGD